MTTTLMARPARYPGDYVLERVDAVAAEIYFEMGWDYPVR